MPATIVQSFAIATFDPLTRNVAYTDPRDGSQHVWARITWRSPSARELKSTFAAIMTAEGLDVLWTEDMRSTGKAS